MRRQKKVASVSSAVVVMSLLPILYASLLRLPPAALARDTTFWFLLSNSIIAIIAAAHSTAAPTITSSSHGHGVDESAPLLAAVVVPAAPAVGHELPAPAPAAVRDDAINRDAPPSSDVPALTSSVSPSSDDPPPVNTSDATIEGEQPDQPQEAASETMTNKSDTLLVVSPSSSSEELAIVTYNFDDDGDSTSFGEENQGAIVPWGMPAPATTTGSGGSSKQYYWQLSDEELNRKVEEFITRFNREMRLQVLQEAGV